MRIMPRRSTKAPIVRLAREYKIYRFFSGKSVGTVEEVESVKTPVETIETEVFGKPVFELVFTLGAVSWERELVG